MGIAFDWDIYKTLAKAFSEMAKDYFTGTFKDVVTTPLSHDTKQEISTPYGVVKDWSKGEVKRYLDVQCLTLQL